MRTSIQFLIFILVFPASTLAQNLSFLGLNEIRFGMHENSMPGKVIVRDTTSSYSDSSVYLRTSSCHLYRRANEKLDLQGFKASGIEYEFCNEKLSYVFIRVTGSADIDKAIASLQTYFPKFNCGKKTPIGSCKLVDTHHKKLRTIVSIDRTKQEMNIVLIAR